RAQSRRLLPLSSILYPRSSTETETETRARRLLPARRCALELFTTVGAPVRPRGPAGAGCKLSPRSRLGRGGGESAAPRLGPARLLLIELQRTRPGPSPRPSPSGEANRHGV